MVQKQELLCKKFKVAELLKDKIFPAEAVSGHDEGADGDKVLWPWAFTH